MIPHYRACTDYGWSCDKGNTLSVAYLFVCGGIALAVAFLKAAWTALEKRAGMVPRPPRPPADSSPAAHALLTGQPTPGYKPSGIRARTPSGITVTVRCPHQYGHRTPDHAHACGMAEKERIERRGW